MCYRRPPRLSHSVRHITSVVTLTSIWTSRIIGPYTGANSHSSLPNSSGVNICKTSANMAPPALHASRRLRWASADASEAPHLVRNAMRLYRLLPISPPVALRCRKIPTRTDPARLNSLLHDETYSTQIQHRSFIVFGISEIVIKYRFTSAVYFRRSKTCTSHPLLPQEAHIQYWLFHLILKYGVFAQLFNQTCALLPRKRNILSRLFKPFSNSTDPCWGSAPWAMWKTSWE